MTEKSGLEIYRPSLDNNARRLFLFRRVHAELIAGFLYRPGVFSAVVRTHLSFLRRLDLAGPAEFDRTIHLLDADRFATAPMLQYAKEV
jgi:hypothetical protein